MVIPVTTGGNAEYVNKAASRALGKKMLYNRNIVFTSVSGGSQKNITKTVNLASAVPMEYSQSISAGCKDKVLKS